MPEMIALNRLERRLDNPASRIVQRAWSDWHGIWQRRRHQRAGLDLAELIRQPGVGTTRLTEGLEHALRAGAFESAEKACERLLEFPLTGRPLELVLETLLLCGERLRAAGLAREHRAELVTSARGASLLEVLELGDGAPWLPNGRPNMLALSRQIETSALGVDGLLALCRRKPWLWLEVPELHLLFFNALRKDDPGRALLFLNRFLDVHELGGYGMCDRGVWFENVLSALEPQVDYAPLEGPLVSVIMPAHNAERSVGYALRSLSTQSYRSLEFLVGDDASNDATLELLLAQRPREPRLRVFRSERRQGAYNLRNALISRARGALLTFHDADDLATPTRIARQVTELRSPSIAACVGNLLRLGVDGRVVFFRDQKATRLCPVSLMLTRQAFKIAGPFRGARVGADQELFRDLLAKLGTEAVKRLRAPLVLSLWSAGSATRQPGVEALEDGYRSPSRRAYSELVYAKHASSSTLDEARIVASLLASDNWLEPSQIVELTTR